MKPACHGVICRADEAGSRLRSMRRQVRFIFSGAFAVESSLR